jgi:hypothetical protein
VPIIPIPVTSEAYVKLIETVKAAGSGLLRPWQDKRVAAAQREIRVRDALAREQVRAVIRDVRAGRQQFLPDGTLAPALPRAAGDGGMLGQESSTRRLTTTPAAHGSRFRCFEPYHRGCRRA